MSVLQMKGEPSIDMSMTPAHWRSSFTRPTQGRICMQAAMTFS